MAALTREIRTMEDSEEAQWEAAVNALRSLYLRERDFSDRGNRDIEDKLYECLLHVERLQKLVNA